MIKKAFIWLFKRISAPIAFCILGIVIFIAFFLTGIQFFFTGKLTLIDHIGNALHEVDKKFDF